MAFKRLMPVIFLGAILILGTMFLTQIFGSVDQGANTSESYKDQYNGTKNVTITTISGVKFIPPILGAVGIVIAIGWISASVKRR